MMLLFGASAAVALGLSWAIGAQDVSNALGTSVGSKAITVRQAIMIGAVFEFAGALCGGEVSNTISTGILDISAFPPSDRGVDLFALALFCTMFGALVWLCVATYAQLPVSTTHSLVGALVGVGLVVGWTEPGVTSIPVQWGNVAKIVSSWVTSPLFGGLVAYITFSCISRGILKSPTPLRSAEKQLPYFTSFTVGGLASFMAMLGPARVRLTAPAALVFGAFIAVLLLSVLTRLTTPPSPKSGTSEPASPTFAVKPTTTVISITTPVADVNIPKSRPSAASSSLAQDDAELTAVAAMEAGSTAGEDNLCELDMESSSSGAARHKAVQVAEAKFRGLMVMTACVVSFAHGSNDISNAVGPFMALVDLYFLGHLSAPGTTSSSSTWVLVAGGVGIVLGLATYGYKVMATVGEKIASLTYARGYAAQVATAGTVLAATQLGLTVSTTHVLIGAISGVALAGADKINTAMLQKIAASWVVTVPAAAAFSLAMFFTVSQVSKLTAGSSLLL